MGLRGETGPDRSNKDAASAGELKSGTGFIGDVSDVAFLESVHLEGIIVEILDDLLEASLALAACEVDEGHGDVDFQEVVVADRIQSVLDGLPIQFRWGNKSLAFVNRPVQVEVFNKALGLPGRFVQVVKRAGGEGEVIAFDNGDIFDAPTVQPSLGVGFGPAPPFGDFRGDDAPAFTVVVLKGLLEGLPVRHFELKFKHGEPEQAGWDVVPEFGGDRDAVAGQALVGGEHALAGGEVGKVLEVIHYVTINGLTIFTFSTC